MNSENKETGKWFASPRSRTDVGCESKPETTCCSSGLLLANDNTVEEDEWGKLLTCLKEKYCSNHQTFLFLPYFEWSVQSTVPMLEIPGIPQKIFLLWKLLWKKDSWSRFTTLPGESHIQIREVGVKI